MSRPMTSAEKKRFRGWFPSLNVTNAEVTGEQSEVYNCIAWTVGATDRWLWPGSRISDFDRFYRGMGLERADAGPIAAWGLSHVNMTHGSISGAGHGPRWESKCGRDLRIQHALNELAGKDYGRVRAFYQRVEVKFVKRLEVILSERFAKTYLLPDQEDALRTQLDEIPDHLREAFNRAFYAWKETWFSGSRALSSDPNTRAAGEEFDALVSLGPQTLPLVIEVLADPENFFALQLYDAIQPETPLILKFEPDDERILEGEQGRAQRVVQSWFANQ